MQGTPTLLVGNTQLTDELVDYYETPVGSVTTIASFALNNTSGRMCEVWIHLVPAGFVAANGNQVATRLRIPPVTAPTQVPALIAQVIPAGAKLQMRSDMPDAVTPTVSGYVKEIP